WATACAYACRPSTFRRATSTSSEFEAVADDRFQHPVLAGAGQAASDREVQLPVRRDIEIDRREDHVALVFTRLPVRDRPRRAVVLDAGRDLRRDVPRHLDAWLELRAAAGIGTLERFREIRIDRQIEAPFLVLENRTDFQRARVGLELRLIEAELEADAD